MRFRLLLRAVLVVQILIIASAGSVVSAASAASSIVLSAGVPFEDGFEAATLGADLSLQTTSNGVVELTTDYERTGAQGVFIGQKAGGNAAASLILALDLTGQTNVFLDFWVRATGGFEYRRIYISDNSGARWVEIRDLDEVSQTFSHEVIDLAFVATSQGLSLNDKFQIRFAYSDYYGRAGGGLVIDDLRLAQRDQVVGGFPFSLEGFETATFVQGFYPQSFNNGVATITTDYPRSGTSSVFLGQNIAGNSSASLVLALDLTGQTDVFLDFWARATGGFEYRRIYISDNSGARWTEIRDLDELSQSYSHHVIDLADVAKREGLALNTRFQISFSYSDYYGRAGGGLVIDDLRLTQRAQAVSNFPIAQVGFEDATFAQGFYPQSFNNGVAAITTDYPRNGTRSVFLGQNVVGDSAASLILVLDLTGQKEVFLDFWVRAAGGFEYRRVYISDDNGASWKEIRDLDEVSQSFSHEVIDLGKAAELAGLALNNKFRVSIAYSDYYGRAGSGMVIDDLQISTIDPVANPSPYSRVFLPMLRR